MPTERGRNNDFNFGSVESEVAREHLSLNL